MRFSKYLSYLTNWILSYSQSYRLGLMGRVKPKDQPHIGQLAKKEDRFQAFWRGLSGAEHYGSTKDGAREGNTKEVSCVVITSNWRLTEVCWSPEEHVSQKHVSFKDNDKGEIWQNFLVYYIPLCLLNWWIPILPLKLWEGPYPVFLNIRSFDPHDSSMRSVLYYF